MKIGENNKINYFVIQREHSNGDIDYLSKYYDPFKRTGDGKKPLTFLEFDSEFKKAYPFTSVNDIYSLFDTMAHLSFPEKFSNYVDGTLSIITLEKSAKAESVDNFLFGATNKKAIVKNKK